MIKSLEPQGHYFHGGRTNAEVLEQLLSHYEVPHAGTFSLKMYEGGVIVSVDVDGAVNGISVGTIEDAEKLMCQHQSLKLKSGVVMNARECHRARVKARINHNYGVIKETESRHHIIRTQVLGLANIAIGLGDVNWSKYGIDRDSKIPEYTKNYLRALGYKVEPTYSTSWKNETIHVSPDLEWLRQEDAYNKGSI
ncbi:hypothetical protein [Vibrio phage YC]|uniref:Uncharacterized protein n=1 Tax=Vibrio phage YC TaxID=2267403 RepID=A0A384ZS95_9CAUD|nr:hypothetical protein HWB64_gp115 [Vibrio phage YC]AXC34484.1 hypothetical protein [Vibrio phage YC]